MKRKETIIRYLAHVSRATRRQIAEQIKASPELTSVKLTELKKIGLVRNVEWADGNKVWVLTKEGGERFEYYIRQDRKRRTEGGN